jgi:hypothetical protein
MLAVHKKMSKNIHIVQMKYPSIHVALKLK